MSSFHIENLKEDLQYFTREFKKVMSQVDAASHTLDQVMSEVNNSIGHANRYETQTRSMQESREIAHFSEKLETLALQMDRVAKLLDDAVLSTVK
ncbi:MAG: hypothetical protein WC444_04640 [Candidatus Paceibacterota bacterium]